MYFNVCVLGYLILGYFANTIASCFFMSNSERNQHSSNNVYTFVYYIYIYIFTLQLRYFDGESLNEDTFELATKEFKSDYQEGNLYFNGMYCFIPMYVQLIYHSETS